MLTGRVRRGQENPLKRARYFSAYGDERRLAAVEELVVLAQDLGTSLPHLAASFAIAHPGVTSALLGARTMEHLDSLLPGAGVVLTDDVLDGSTRSCPPALMSACWTRRTHRRP